MFSSTKHGLKHSKTWSAEERAALAALCPYVVDKRFYLTATDEEVDRVERGGIEIRRRTPSSCPAPAAPLRPFA